MLWFELVRYGFRLNTPYLIRSPATKAPEAKYISRHDITPQKLGEEIAIARASSLVLLKELSEM